MAIRFNVPPEHNGLLLEAVGVEGAAGLRIVKGPIEFEMHPLMVTVISEYVPAERLLRMTIPELFEDKITETGNPFLLY